MTQNNSSAFDQAISQAETVLNLQGSAPPSPVARENALAIIARAISDEIKAGKPVVDVYGQHSLTKLMMAMVATGDIAVFDHLAHDIAQAFGAQRTADLPENAGVLHSPTRAQLTHSEWVLLTEAKKAMAETAKEIAGVAKKDAIVDMPAWLDHFVNALSGLALYVQPAPIIPARPTAATETAESAASAAAAPKKRPSM